MKTIRQASPRIIKQTGSVIIGSVETTSSILTKIGNGTVINNSYIPSTIARDSELPTLTSQLTNDSNFVNQTLTDTLKNFQLEFETKSLVRNNIISNNQSLYSRYFSNQKKLLDNIKTNPPKVLLNASRYCINPNFFTTNETLTTQTIYLPVGVYTFGLEYGGGTITSSSGTGMGTATVTAHQTATSGRTGAKTIEVTTAGTVIFTVSAVVKRAILNRGYRLLGYIRNNGISQQLVNIGTDGGTIGVFGNTSPALAQITRMNTYAGQIINNSRTLANRLETSYELSINTFNFSIVIIPNNFTSDSFLLADKDLAKAPIFVVRQTSGKLQIGSQDTIYYSGTDTTNPLTLNEPNFVSLSIKPNDSSAGNIDYIIYLRNSTVTEVKTGTITAPDWLPALASFGGKSSGAYFDGQIDDIQLGEYKTQAQIEDWFNQNRFRYGNYPTTYTLAIPNPLNYKNRTPLVFVFGESHTGFTNISDLPTSELQTYTNSNLLSYNPVSNTLDTFQMGVNNNYSCTSKSTPTFGFATTRFGCELTLLQHLGEKYGKVILVKLAAPGTIINIDTGQDWNSANNELTLRLIDHINKAIVLAQNQGLNPFILGGVKFLGQNDGLAVGQTPSQFLTQNIALDNRIRARFGFDLPIIQVGLRRGFSAENLTYDNTIQSYVDLFNRYISVTDLSTFDGSHYNATGQLMLGERIAKVFINSYF